MTIAPAPTTPAPRDRGLWRLLLPLIIALNLGFQFCAEKVAMATQGMPFGIDWILAVVAQPWTAIIVVCEILSFAVWMVVLARAAVGTAFLLTAIGYVFVTAMALFVFHERAGLAQWLGSIAILAGVYLLGEKTPGKKV